MPIEISQLAARLNFVMTENNDADFTINVNEDGSSKSFTNYTAELIVHKRQKRNEENRFYESTGETQDNVELELTTSNGGLTLSSGQITGTFEAGDTKDMEGSYPYHLTLIDGNGDRDTILKGFVIVNNINE